MTEEEKKLFRLYGKLPTHKNVLMNVQKVHFLLSNSNSRSPYCFILMWM
jgi:hypothetical protein